MQRLRVATIGMIIALSLVLGCVIISTFEAGAQRNKAERWYVHTLDVLVLTAELKATLQAALRSERGYILTRDPTFTKPLDDAEASAPKLLTQLSALTIDNPRQQAVLRLLTTGTSLFLTNLQGSVQQEQSRTASFIMQPDRHRQTRREIEQLLRLVENFEAQERSLLSVRQMQSRAAEEALLFNRILLAATGVILLVALAIAAVLGIRAYGRALLISAELQRLAVTDELTGLRNRRSFVSTLKSEIGRAERTGAPVCLVLLDIDHFKRVNDQHGHPAGDEVLRVVAQLLRESIRAGDAAARFGGEEFALVMPGTDFARCQLVCERIRASIANRPIRLASGETVSLSVSSGAAMLLAGETDDGLIRRADEALYRAKAAGRNRVTLAA